MLLWRIATTATKAKMVDLESPTRFHRWYTAFFSKLPAEILGDETPLHHRNSTVPTEPSQPILPQDPDQEWLLPAFIVTKPMWLSFRRPGKKRQAVLPGESSGYL